MKSKNPKFHEQETNENEAHDELASVTASSAPAIAPANMSADEQAEGQAQASVRARAGFQKEIRGGRETNQERQIGTKETDEGSAEGEHPSQHPELEEAQTNIEG